MERSAISASQLRSEVASKNPPILIDVRQRPTFAGADEMIAGALRREPEQVHGWSKSLPSASSVVVYCVHGHEVSQRVAAALNESGIATRYLEGGLEAWKAAEGSLDHKPRDASTRWVTRERPKIDRIACPWLIARFVDPDVHFSHDGELCSFDAFLKHYRLSDPALNELAVIVRGADTARLDIAPQAAGLAAISLGLSRNYQDDPEMLKHGMVMYDALYAWCKEGKEEVHTWKPQAYR